MIYLDNSATTQPYPEVVEVFAKALRDYYGNPSSLHHLGEEAEQILNKARELTAELLGVEAKEIIFTSGGTEGNNLAIYGVARQYVSRGNHIITSQIEHPSVLESIKRLEQEGYRVTYLPVDSNGMVSIQTLKESIQEDTILVSIMHVNNELGTIQPIEEIGAMLKSYPKILFHVDAVQSFGKIPVAPKKWGVDLMTLSGHKIHGPKGVGVLYKSDKVKLYPLFVGGGQENGVRPGTENLPGIVAFAKAMRISKDRESDFAKKVGLLRKKLWEGIKELPSVYLNSPENGAPHILNISFAGIKPEVLVHSLEQKGIYVSTKSACSSKNDKISHVLKAAGLPMERATSAIRISLAYTNSEWEIDQTIEAFHEILPKIQGVKKR